MAPTAAGRVSGTLADRIDMRRRTGRRQPRTSDAFVPQGFGQLRPRGHTEPEEDAVEKGPDGPGRKAEFLADLTVGQPTAGEFGDPPFLRTEQVTGASRPQRVRDSAHCPFPGHRWLRVRLPRSAVPPHEPDRSRPLPGERGDERRYVAIGSSGHEKSDLGPSIHGRPRSTTSNGPAG